jgi:hypothetical protein
MTKKKSPKRVGGEIKGKTKTLHRWLEGIAKHQKGDEKTTPSI